MNRNTMQCNGMEIQHNTILYIWKYNTIVYNGNTIQYNIMEIQYNIITM